MQGCSTASLQAKSSPRSHDIWPVRIPTTWKKLAAEEWEAPHIWIGTPPPCPIPCIWIRALLLLTHPPPHPPHLNQDCSAPLPPPPSHASRSGPGCSLTATKSGPGLVCSTLHPGRGQAVPPLHVRIGVTPPPLLDQGWAAPHLPSRQIRVGMCTPPLF